MTLRNPFLRRPWLSAALLPALAIPALWPPEDPPARSDPAALLELSPGHRKALDQVQEILPGREMVVIDMECPEVFSREGLDAIRRASEALLSVEGALEIKSLTHAYRPVRRGLRLEMVPLVQGQDHEQLRRFCLENPFLRNVMVSPDGRHTSLTLAMEPTPGRLLRQRLEEALAPFEEEGLRFHMASLSLAQEDIHGWIDRDARRILPFAALFVLACLAFVLRSPALILFLLLHQAATLAFVAGSLQWSGHVPAPHTYPLLLPLWCGVHLALWLHLCNACRKAASRLPSREVVPAALGRIGRSCLYATLTTLAGLLSLGMAEVPSVREIAWLGAYGVAAIFLSTFGPGAGLLHLWSRRWKAPARPGEDADPVSLLTRWRPVILGAAALGALGMAAGVPRLQVGILLSQCLPVKSATRQAGEIFDRHYGGFHFFRMEFDSGRDGGINQPGFLRHLERLGRQAQADPRVTAVYSYPQLLSLIEQAWQGEEPGALSLPPPERIGLFALLIRSSLQAFPFMENLCDGPMRSTSLFVRTREMPSGQSLALLGDLAEQARTGLPEGASLRASQGFEAILEADRRLVRTQLLSIACALPAILALLWFLWRSFRLALLAVAVNAVPVGALAALAALLGIPLHFITVITVALAFGIAIDDTVHLITEWSLARRRGLSPRQATAQALRIKTHPIVCTSVILGGVFALAIPSSFPPMSHFAFLTAAAFAMALASSLCLLPLILAGGCRSLRPWPARAGGQEEGPAPQEAGPGLEKDGRPGRV